MDLEDKIEAYWGEFTKEAQALVPEPFKFWLASADFQVTKPQPPLDKARHGSLPLPRLSCELKQTKPYWIRAYGGGGFEPSERRYLFDADDIGVFLCAERSHKKLSPGEAAKEIVGPFLEQFK